MYEQFMKEIDKYNASMTDMLNKEDRDKNALPGGPGQTLGTAGYAVVDATKRDPNEPIVINEPFHIVGTPEEEAEQKRIIESVVTTSYSGPITKEELSDFTEKLKNDPAIHPDSYCK